MSQDLRAVEWLNDWIAENWNKFDENVPDVYGVADSADTIDIIASKLRVDCQKVDINYKRLVSYLDKKNALVTNPGRKDKVVRIGASRPRCISVKKDFIWAREKELSPMSPNVTKNI